jgi:hypothetical protein
MYITSHYITLQNILIQIYRELQQNICNKYGMGTDSVEFGNEAHFVSFAAIVATRNRTEGSNFHI